MAYRRKSSEVIADAQERAAQPALDAYNGLLAQVDAAGNNPHIGKRASWTILADAFSCESQANEQDARACLEAILNF